MDDVLEPVSFLAGSSNRVAVLDALADGARTRDQLSEVIPASRVTVGRILDDFDDRWWVTAGESGYELTHLGRLLHAAFDDLLREVRRIDDLEPLLPSFPRALDLDLTLLDDAEVVLARPSNPFSILRGQALRLKSADGLRLVTGNLVPSLLWGLLECIDGGSARIELVAPRSAYESLAADPATADGLRTLLTADVTDCAWHPVDVPGLTIRGDDGVDILVTNEHETPIGVVRSDSPDVLEWCERRFDTERAAASPVDAAAFEWPDDPG